METESADRLSGSKGSGKKSKTRKNKRRKHKHSKSNQEPTTSGGEDLHNTSDPPGLRQEDGVRASVSDPTTTWSGGEPPAINGTLSDTQVGMPERSQGRVPDTSLPPRNEVRVKQEPLSDQEEESHQIPSTTKVGVGKGD